MAALTKKLEKVNVKDPEGDTKMGKVDLIFQLREEIKKLHEKLDKKCQYDSSTKYINQAI